jgi:proteic killer suppression protein
MIKSFADKRTHELYDGMSVKQFSAFREKAERKLLMIDCAHNLEDLKNPPGNKLEMLRGDRKKYYSIRIDRQWRICFRWENNNAYDVEIVDYH